MSPSISPGPMVARRLGGAAKARKAVLLILAALVAASVTVIPISAGAAPGDAPPLITSSPAVAFTVGTAGSFLVTADGTPTPTFTQEGPLPSALTFVDNLDGTALISGTPDPGTGGSYDMTITATNTSGSDVQLFTLIVDQPPVITSSATTTFSAGVPGNFQVTTSGFPAALLTTEGVLPQGVTFADNGDGTGTLSGTPLANAGGSYVMTITADNGVDIDVQRFNLIVSQAPAITSSSATTFTVGVLGDFPVTSTGFPVPALSITGALPSGVNFVDNGNGTAHFFGTPDPATGGSYVVTITAGNGIGTAATQHFTLGVGQAPLITSGVSTAFLVGSAGDFPITSTGFPLPALSLAGSLPSGVNFADNGNGTGHLFGTPASGTGGSYVVTLTAGNGIGPVATQQFTLTVNQAPAITSAASITFIVGNAGVFPITTVGFPVPSLSLTGALPSGVNFSDNGNGTAQIAGTPDAGTAGSYDVTITAGNGIGSDAVQRFQLVVALTDTAPPVTTIGGFVEGHWYNTDVTFSLTATDNPGGVGVRDSHYRVGAGGATTYTAGVPVSAEGTTIVSFWSVDNNGNVEATKTAPIQIDKTPPTTSSDAVASYTVSAHITLSATDLLSGVASTHYSVDGSAFATGTVADVSTVGPHTLRMYSVDVAGNQEASSSASFVVHTMYSEISGTDRYGTAIAASRAAFATATTVVIATGENFPDGIAGSSLAGAYDAPLLLTRTHSLPTNVAAEITRLGATKAIILGGLPAVGTEVETALDTQLGAGNVRRIGGVDRYSTAALIASETVDAIRVGGGVYDGSTLIAFGGNFPDALAAAPIACNKVRPILLSRDTTLGAFTRAGLARIGATNAVVLGSPAAVGTAPFNELVASMGAGNVSRLGAADRYGTAALVAEYGVSQGLKWDGVAVATGMLFPDALSGGVLQGKHGSVLVLTRNTSLPPATSLALQAHRLEIAHLNFLGSPAAISSAVRAQCQSAIGF